MSTSSASPSVPYSWLQAWENAQPRLLQIQDSLASTTSPSPRVVRVGQLDAELLDQELVQLLKDPLVKALSLVNSVWKARFEPELVLLIQLTLYKFSVWDLGASYGAKLQGLRYTVPNDRNYPKTGSGLPYHTLFAHGTLTLLIPYLHTRLRGHALSYAWPDAPSSDRRRKAWEFLTRLESTHSLFGLLNFIAFLWNGRYRTTVDRLLKLRLAPARRLARRDVSYEFMNRQMVWHAFTEFLLFLLPLINMRGLRRRIAGFSSHITLTSILPRPVRSIIGLISDTDGRTETREHRGKYWALSPSQCAICAENASSNLNLADSANAMTVVASMATYTNTTQTPHERASNAESSTPDAEPPSFPIHNPYVTSCGHTYCYYCVTDRMLRTAEERSGVGSGGTHWECLRCAEPVTGADRFEAEAQGPEYESGVDDDDELDYEYGSEDMEFTDMSGSVGTYSESGLSE